MNNKFQKGDKVRIISKSIGCTSKDSSVYKRGKGIGYVINANHSYTSSDKCVMVNSKKEGIGGDFFTYEDLELYDNSIDSMFDDIIDAL